MYTILCIMTCHHFLKKNEWITNVLGLREHKVRSNPLVSVELTELRKKFVCYNRSYRGDLSIFVYDIFSSGSGFERLLRAFFLGEEVAYGIDRFSVCGLYRVDYISHVRSSAK